MKQRGCFKITTKLENLKRQACSQYKSEQDRGNEGTTISKSLRKKTKRVFAYEL